jgi:hypothetical protein
MVLISTGHEISFLYSGRRTVDPRRHAFFLTTGDEQF